VQVPNAVPVEPDADVETEVETPPHLDSSLSRTGSVEADDITFNHIESPDNAEVATLSHGLNRVLFSPGVHWLQDPRSSVWNFDPVLSTLPYPSEFNFDKLRPFVPPSQDKRLWELMRQHGRKFSGSTSSLTSALSHIWVALRGGNENLNVDMLSEAFSNQVCASNAFLWKCGLY
jgi:hypothetical protein